MGARATLATRLGCSVLGALIEGLKGGTTAEAAVADSLGAGCGRYDVGGGGGRADGPDSELASLVATARSQGDSDSMVVLLIFLVGVGGLRFRRRMLSSRTMRDVGLMIVSLVATMAPV